MDQVDEVKDVTSLDPEMHKIKSLNDSGSDNSSSDANDAEMVFLDRRAPLAPKHLPTSSRITEKRSSPPLLGFTPKVAYDSFQQIIPQFYFSNGYPPPNQLKEQCISRTNHIFINPDGSLQMHEFKSVTKEVCRLPSFFSSTLFTKIDINCTGEVTRDAFINYWIGGNMLTMDTATQIYKILKQPDNEYLSKDDFKPILQELLETHPGLEFLETQPKFQERYAETVICRIFYYHNRSGNGRLTLGELKRGNLIAAMQQVDEEEDINEVLRYFSYKHFFVIWGKFVELDTDEDFLISKDDLSTYADYALSSRIIERIFSQAPRKFTSNVEGRMRYEDFVYFLLSEEDKSSEASIEYWFKCLDLEGNGMLTPGELKFFYEEQRNRMTAKPKGKGEKGPWELEDMLRQVFDMIAPQRKEHVITLRDLKRSELSGDVFNFLFNHHKSQQPRRVQKEKHGPYLPDWDVFAEKVYIIMAKEAEEDAAFFLSD